MENHARAASSLSVLSAISATARHFMIAFSMSPCRCSRMAVEIARSVGDDHGFAKAFCAASSALAGSSITVCEVTSSLIEITSSRVDLISLRYAFALSLNRENPKKPTIAATTAIRVKTTAISVRKTATTSSHQSTAFIRSLRISRRKSLNSLQISTAVIVSKAVSLGFGVGVSCMGSADGSVSETSLEKVCSTGIGEVDSTAGNGKPVATVAVNARQKMPLPLA